MCVCHELFAAPASPAPAYGRGEAGPVCELPVDRAVTAVGTSVYSGSAVGSRLACGVLKRTRVHVPCSVTASAAAVFSHPL